MAWIEFDGWAHGRVWKGKNGRLSFYIRRNGKDHATGASTLPGALAALERFEKTGEARAPEYEPVFLDVALATEFLAASKAKGNSREWRRNQRQHLDWWARQLAGKDLRGGRQGSVTMSHIRGALASAPSARQREAVLRAVYSFLRGADRIETNEDPTFGKPHAVAPGRPAQDRVDKAISPEAFAAVRKHLEAEHLKRGRTGRRWADLIAVLAGTGMHVSELHRFAASGGIEPLPAGRKRSKAEDAVLVVPMHKSGAPHRIAVDRDTADAARRTRDAGPFSIAVFYGVLREAATETGEKVLPGRFRHTVAKAAVNGGATIEAVGNFLGHRSPATTKKFYATLGVPVNVLPPNRAGSR